MASSGRAVVERLAGGGESEGSIDRTRFTIQRRWNFF
jgi:hypothetical protein